MTPKYPQGPVTPPPGPGPSSGPRYRTLVLVGVLGALCAGVPSFVVGLLWGEFRSRTERGDRDVRAAEKVLAAHADRPGARWINRGPGETFHVEGFVRTRQELDELQDELTQALGKDRAQEVLAVTVRGRDPYSSGTGPKR